MDILNRHGLIVAVSATALLLTGCGRQGGGTHGAAAELDSLRAENESNRQQLSAVYDMIGAVNKTLDSISLAEGMLFGDPRQETSPTRGSVLESLERFEQVLLRQHRRIDELDSIAATNKTDEGLRKLIAHMKEQLAEKDREIAALRRELNGQDADLGRLRRRVAAQTKELARQGDELVRLGAKADRQATALARQDQELNNAYVMIATKAELKKRGVARRGKVASDGLADPSMFTKVDIRRLGEMTFKAKKARILTNMPTSAYTLAKNGDGTYTLRITDKTRFWSASKFLVIQTN